MDMEAEIWKARCEMLEEAIRTHRSQKADDRCVEDDDRLYEALGDGIKCDRRVGDKHAMIQNCQRFITQRCDGGGWKSYAELEAELAEQKKINVALAERCAGQSEVLSARANRECQEQVRDHRPGSSQVGGSA